MKSPQLKFKVIIYLFLFFHKVEAKVWGYTFPLNLSWFLLQRLIEFTNLKSDEQIIVRNWTQQICDLKLFLIFYSLQNGCQVEIKIVYILVILAVKGTQIN